MLKYNLASLAASAGVLAPGTRVKLQPIDYRNSTQTAYLKAERVMLKAIAAEVRQTLIPAAQADKRRRLTRDVDQSSFDQLRALSATMARISGDMVERVLRLESIRHTETFRDEARRALGLDLSAIVRQEDLDDYLKTAMARNTSLIKSQADDVVKRIEQAIIQNELAGRSVKDLKAVLVDQLGIADRRAQLIARDQTAKLNSDMNRIRQEQAGIESYEWVTSGDERVRPLHKGLSGNEYSWGQPTGAEGGLPPGQPIQCRCIASAIVDFNVGLKKKRSGSTPGPAVAILPTAAKVARRATRKVAPGPAMPAIVPAPMSAEAKAAAARTSLVARIAKLDDEAKDYVLTLGKKDGKEHLSAYDSVLGLPVSQITSGKKSHVAFTPELVAVIRNPGSSIVIHHNHPGSSSFSPQDLDVMTKYPGVKGIWAHGHNGSSYYAEKGTVQYETWRYTSTQKALTKMVQAKVDALPASGSAPDQHKKNVQVVDDWNAIFYHVIALAIDAQKRIKYQATLVGKTAEAAERLKDEIAELLERLK